MSNRNPMIPREMIDITPQKRPFTPSPSSGVFSSSLEVETESNSIYNQAEISSLEKNYSYAEAELPSTHHSGRTKGLNNLGNTCFMNSALQCLSATSLLTEYFLKGYWSKELNTTNPLGMEGQVPQMYANLMENLWLVDGSSFAPREMKYLIGLRNPAFVGYGQQDSQELLGFLLDGLHEDLNRIQERTYTEDPDWDPLKMTEDEFAKISWETYKKRNDSIIVDLFQGQLKSRLECQVCWRVSVKFDAYMYLQLPIPEPLTKRITVCVYQSSNSIRAAVFSVAKQYPDISRYDSQSASEDVRSSFLDFLEKTRDVLAENRIRKISVEVPCKGTIMDLKIAVARYMGWSLQSADQASCSEVFQCRLYKKFDDTEPLSSISLNDVVYLFPFLDMNALKIDPVLGPTIPSTLEDVDDLTSAFEILSVFSLVTFSLENGRKEILAPMNISLPSYMSFPEGNLALLGKLLYRLLVERLAPFSNIPLFRRVGTSFSFEEIASSNEASPCALNISFYPVSEDWEPVPNLFRINVLDYDCIYPLADEEKVQKDTKYYNNHIIGSPKSDSSELAHQLERNGSIEGEPDVLTESAIPLSPPLKQAYTHYFSHYKSLDIRVGFSESVAKKLFSANYSWSYENFEPLLDKSLTVEEGKGKPLNLADCMAEFTKEELLNGNDCFYCSLCKEHQPTKKKLSVFSVPDVLVIHLKRFSNSGRYSSSRAKLEVFVDAPETGLDMSILAPTRFVDGVFYDLFAVSNHFGGLGGGHYTAFAKNHVDGKWYNCDDSHVSEISGEKLISKAAYLLFYQKRTLKKADEMSTTIKEAASRLVERLEADLKRKKMEEGERKREFYRSKSLIHHESFSSLKREPSASTLDENSLDNDTEVSSIPHSFHEASAISNSEEGGKTYITEYP